ncbi:hypothetical protein ACFT7S_17570 [Streptomyces sp. NPDC057136]|uniref:hypothetical protein n=1 Tax=Streptomyces sp. NPDC057136 TaxID=3346029 RepID=UPI0036357E10
MQTDGRRFAKIGGDKEHVATAGYTCLRLRELYPDHLSERLTAPVVDEPWPPSGVAVTFNVDTIDGPPWDTIAQALGISEEAAGKRLNRYTVRHCPEPVGPAGLDQPSGSRTWADMRCTMKRCGALPGGGGTRCAPLPAAVRTLRASPEGRRGRDECCPAP